MSVYEALFSMMIIASLPFVPGCAVEPGGAESAGEGEEGEIGEAQQALSCVDATCTGVNPFATTCVLDQQAVKTGPINGPNGQLGTATLYYSPTCHAIWGYASFNTTHGSFKVCAQNATFAGQAAQCTSYGSTFFGANSPMQYLRVNDAGNASVFVNSPTLGSGGTAFFTRTF